MSARYVANTRELRVQRTYRLLKEAFVCLLEEKGYDQITVQEICEKAMVRRTTFYQHFENKQDFLHWFIREKQHEFSRVGAEAIAPDNIREYYVHLLKSLIRYLNENDQFVHILLDAGLRGRMLIDSFADACAEDLAHRMEGSAGFREKYGDLPLSLFSEYYIAGMVSAARWWHMNGKPCTEDELVDYIRRIVMRGEHTV